MNKHKLYPGLVKAVIQTLTVIFVENKKADKGINATLKSNPKWGSKDRAFIAENTYDLVRNWRLAKYLVEVEWTDNHPATLVKTVAGWLALQDYDTGVCDFLDKVNIQKIKDRYTEAQKDLRLKYSYPDWLFELLEQEFGSEKVETELEAMHKQANVFIRVNSLKTNKEKLQSQLLEHHIETEDIAKVPNALRLKKRQNVFGLELFRTGHFEVQDVGSQIIGEALDVQSTDRVVDACAGAGGKSLLLAAKMENKGRLIALDVEEYKLEELKTRAKRNGIFNIEAKLIGSKTIKRLHDHADKLLLDVPCSGLGVLKRNPDAKWKLQPDFIQKLQKVQTDILNQYSKILKKGGIMIYATCSILSEENEKQVEKFISENPEYKLLEQRRLSPANEGFDGFYYAKIKKK